MLLVNYVVFYRPVVKTSVVVCPVVVLAVVVASIAVVGISVTTVKCEQFDKVMENSNNA